MISGSYPAILAAGKDRNGSAGPGPALQPVGLPEFSEPELLPDEQYDQKKDEKGFQEDKEPYIQGLVGHAQDFGIVLQDVHAPIEDAIHDCGLCGCVFCRP